MGTVMADLAALHEAADALARACQDADAGLMFEAAFAAERADLAAITAFGPGTPELAAWRRVLGVVDAELAPEGAVP